MELIAEIVAIGDELTTGQRLDTNSQYLSQRLAELGIQVRFHTTVGDELEDNVMAFQTAASRADIVIATGGLGPTADDLTREALAAAFSLPLELRPEAMEHIEAIFALRKRPMPERNRVQAMFPKTSHIIPNPHGTAPGVDLSVTARSSEGVARACRIFALPGVPAEMVEMLDEAVVPRMVQELGAGATHWRYHSLKVFGIGESDVEKAIPNLIERNRTPRVGITVSKATITLRIAAQCESDSEFQKAIEPTVKEIREALGLLVYGEGDVELHEVVCQLLRSHHLRIGVIEIGAGCRICHMLAKEQTDSPYGLRAARWLVDANELKATLQPNTALENEPGELADWLSRAAESMLKEYRLDLCLAAGIYPTLEDVSTAKLLPYSDFTLSLARAGRSTKSTTVTLGGHPEVIYHRLAKTALNFLRLDLLRA